MFDEVTASLLRSVPPIGDVDTDRLPEELTRAYASIVSARMAAAEGGTLFDQLASLRALANSYEAYAICLPDARGRRAAAFLAASAHELLHRARSTEGLGQGGRSRLSLNAISSDISSMLLFLIAGYPTDAHELANQMSTDGATEIETSLLRGLRDLGRGDLAAVAETTVPSVSDEGTELADRAGQRLWAETLRGLRALSRTILGVPDPGATPAVPREHFDRVRTLSVASLDTVTEGDVFSTFAGPHHLATLLRGSCDDLIGSAVSRLPSPPGVDGQRWTRHLHRLARTRPYLWPNHYNAVSSGVLMLGTSATVSFPTGAGKSTLAELKIAAALYGGARVVVLVPTHALAWQHLESLRRTFADVNVGDALVGDGFYSELGLRDDPAIAVMTPERCLMLTGLAPKSFDDVGLVVFDECHLLHPRDGHADRRAVDAMLCLLGLVELAPSADLLLMSAMMANGAELADWIAGLTGRPCLDLENPWRPTRQVRGCVVYDRARLDELSRVLVNERRHSTTRQPGSALKRRLTAKPRGFFGLKQSWSTRAVEDYADVELLTGEVALGVSSRWGLTGNTNVVAATLAAQMARMGIQTLVFVQNKDHSQAIVRTVAKALDGTVAAAELSDDEREWLRLAVEDLGHVRHLLGPVSGLAAPHHGLLLPAERRLSESMFSRPDGLRVLVATPTLAQGMNLPAEAVVIAGEGRFDAAIGRRAQLSAHELLNAAGRAGRAGHRASGFVLVVPSAVVGLDVPSAQIGESWGRLRSQVFGRSDQCLRIDDPFEYLIDSIAAAGRPVGDTERYFITRLPARQLDDGDAAAAGMLDRTIAALRARRANATREYRARVRRVLEIRREMTPVPERPTWIKDVAVASGVAPMSLVQLDEALRSQPVRNDMSTLDCVGWLERFLAAPSDRVSEIMGEHARRAIEDHGDRVRHTHGQMIRHLFDRLRAWMTGATLEEIERTFGTGRERAYCRRARVFQREVVLDLSYAAGLVAQVRRAQLSAEEAGGTMPTSLAVLAACVREGFDCPQKLAIFHCRRPRVSRVGCHRAYETLGDDVRAAQWDEPYAVVLERVRHAIHGRTF